DEPVEGRVGRVVDDRAAVVALQVDRVDAAELAQLGDQLRGPERRRVELEAEAGVELEPGAQLRRAGRVTEAAGGDEPDRPRLPAHRAAERRPRLPQREVERCA